MDNHHCHSGVDLLCFFGEVMSHCLIVSLVVLGQRTVEAVEVRGALLLRCGQAVEISGSLFRTTVSFQTVNLSPVKTFCRPRSSSVSVFIPFMLVTKQWHFCFHIKIVGKWMIPPNFAKKTSPCHLDAQEQQQQKLQEHPIG